MNRNKNLKIKGKALVLEDEAFSITDSEDSSTSSNEQTFEMNQPFVMELHELQRDEELPDNPLPEVKTRKLLKKKRPRPAQNQDQEGLSTDSERSIVPTEKPEEFFDARENFYDFPENQISKTALDTIQVTPDQGPLIIAPVTQVPPAQAVQPAQPAQPADTLTLVATVTTNAAAVPEPRLHSGQVKQVPETMAVDESKRPLEVALAIADDAPATVTATRETPSALRNNDTIKRVPETTNVTNESKRPPELPLAIADRVPTRNAATDKNRSALSNCKLKSVSETTIIKGELREIMPPPEIPLTISDATPTPTPTREDAPTDQTPLISALKKQNPTRK